MAHARKRVVQGIVDAGDLAAFRCGRPNSLVRLVDVSPGWVLDRIF